jgi:hypothetical protein
MLRAFAEAEIRIDRLSHDHNAAAATRQGKLVFMKNQRAGFGNGLPVSQARKIIKK